MYAEADTYYLSKRQLWRPGLSASDIDWTAGFEIDHQTPIATMGSCFALSVADWLTEHGFRIVRHNPIDGSGPWGKVYTPANFDQLMRHAVGAWEPTLEPWVAVDGTKVDPYRKWVPVNRATSYDALREDTRAVLREAEVFILTLGLTEAWFDGEDDCLYQAPPEHLFGQDPSRYSLRVLSVDQTLGHLWNGITCARRVNPDLRFLLTVSPVPLTATFRQDCDIWTANLDSKTTLRLAARELAGVVGVEGLPDVHYFPSYEMAMTRPNGFQADGRHVTPGLVAYVMDRFQKAYVAT